MSLKVYENLEQGSDEWLEARRGILTASTVGKLITARTVRPASNDYSRALTMQLVTERISGFVEPVYVTADMQRGQDDEPIARDLYAEKYAPVTEVGFMVRTETDWTLGYSPDGLISDNGLLEIKSRKPRHQVATILSDQVPPYHMAQVQAGLLVTGREWLDYCSYSGGLPMWTKRVYPDPKWHAAIIEAAQEFERTAADMTDKYTAATIGLPATERRPDYTEIVI